MSWGEDKYVQRTELPVEAKRFLRLFVFVFVFGVVFFRLLKLSFNRVTFVFLFFYLFFLVYSVFFPVKILRQYLVHGRFFRKPK